MFKMPILFYHNIQISTDKKKPGLFWKKTEAFLKFREGEGKETSLVLDGYYETLHRHWTEVFCQEFDFPSRVKVE